MARAAVWGPMQRVTARMATSTNGPARWARALGLAALAGALLTAASPSHARRGKRGKRRTSRQHRASKAQPPPARVPLTDEVLHEALATLRASYLHLETIPSARLVTVGLEELRAARPGFAYAISQDKLVLWHQTRPASVKRVPMFTRQAAAVAWPLKDPAAIAQALSFALVLSSRSKAEFLQGRTAVIRALMASTGDPFSVYSTRAELDTQRGRAGIEHAEPGVDVLPTLPTRIKGVRPGSDAAAQGVRAGDTLVQVAGRDTARMRYGQVVQALSGAKGSTVAVRVKRPGGATRDMLLRRTVLQSSSVYAQALGDGVVYARVGAFGPGTAERLRGALSGLQPTGIVLDLRHNPGGLLQAGVEFLNLFFSDGPLGGVKPRPGRPSDAFNAFRHGREVRAPLVVLVDGQTASVAEYVTLVLRERRRAVVIGAQTLGKGSVQRIIDLPEGGRMRITVASYASPAGKGVDRNGLTPDVVLAPPVGGTVLEGGAPATDGWVLFGKERLHPIAARRPIRLRVFGPEKLQGPSAPVVIP